VLNPNLDRAGLVDRTSIDNRTGVFLNWHRLPGDRCLVDEGMSSDNFPIHWDTSPRPNEHFVIRRDILDSYLGPRSVSTDGRYTRQQINEMLNGLAASANRKPLQDLCDENEECDDTGRKDLTNR
jgi:hypothetical protein